MAMRDRDPLTMKETCESIDEVDNKNKEPLAMKEVCVKMEDKEPLTTKDISESVIKKDKVPWIKKVRIRFARKGPRQDLLTNNC